MIPNVLKVVNIATFKVAYIFSGLEDFCFNTERFLQVVLLETLKREQTLTLITSNMCDFTLSFQKILSA